MEGDIRLLQFSFRFWRMASRGHVHAENPVVTEEWKEAPAVTAFTRGKGGGLGQAGKPHSALKAGEWIITGQLLRL